MPFFEIFIGLPMKKNNNIIIIKLVHCLKFLVNRKSYEIGVSDNDSSGSIVFEGYI